MYPRILHIYGPLWIQSYGLMIVIGLCVVIYLTYTNPIRKTFLSDEHFASMVTWGILGAFVGGRLYSVLTEWSHYQWYEMFLPWVGGFGILGAILGVLVLLSLFFRFHTIPGLPVFDLIALYVPLLQALSRIGCFLAGCCYGVPAHTLFCAVTYTNHASLAPLNISLHPAQLYASAASFFIFVFLMLVVRHCVTKAGQIVCIYLFCESSARFVLDWWRGDRVFVSAFEPSSMVQMFSFSQWAALFLATAALYGFYVVTTRNQSFTEKKMKIGRV